MISLEDIRRAAERLGDDVVRTPLFRSTELSRRFGGEVYLKLENLQRTGSFKIRGAVNKIRAERERIGPAGVVAASAGNHAQGVAWAARRSGVTATVVMPAGASISKQEATRAHGARVLIQGANVGESIAAAARLVRDGAVLVHPFDDPLVMAGQGTVGLEIFEDLPSVDRIVVPVGGGGLVAGIASALARLGPETDIVGVQTAACPSAEAALRSGAPVSVPSTGSLADGITVKEVGRGPFEVIRRRVGTVVTVEEGHIAAAVLLLLEKEKILVEGAGAVPVAALLAGRIPVEPGSRTVLVLSGGNLDSPLLGKIIAKGLADGGRIVRIGVDLPDVPGALAGLLARVAALEANILHIHHDRRRTGLPINVSAVDIELETRGRLHIEAVVKSLRNEGYALTLS